MLNTGPSVHVDTLDVQAGAAPGRAAGNLEGGSASDVSVDRPAVTGAAQVAVRASAATVTASASTVTVFTEWGWQDFERCVQVCTST